MPQESPYIPPFTVSPAAINLVAEISAQIERYAIRMEQEDGLRLRKANRIKTIHSSLAIEGNTLSEEEVRDIIDGKNVVAPIRQIQEVKNAIKTYELYPTLDAFKEKYPHGYADYLSDIIKVDKPDGSCFYAVSLEVPDAIYLVKIKVKVDDREDIENGLFKDDD